MRNYFLITGYAVNKRGLTVGIGYQLTSSDTKTATAHAVLQAQREGLSHVRMTRARNGLAHVMTDLVTQLNDEQAEIVYCWLSKVLTIVDMARIDAEGSA